MSKIGYLKPYNTGTYEELHGEIKTLQFQLKLKFLPDLMRTNEKAPDYTIYADVANGDDIEIGAAWKKNKQKLDGNILEFLSMTIDDPSLPSALNVAAFKQDDGSYEISWRRRQVTQQETA